jgi:hypothetical protein
MRHGRVLLAFALLLAACGRDPLEDPDGGANGGNGAGAAGGSFAAGGSGGSAMSPFLTSAYCKREIDRLNVCGLPVDLGRCQRDSACYGKLFRKEAQAGVVDCLTSRACGANDDACFAQGAAPFIKAPAFVRFRDACSAKVLGCGGTASAVRDNCADVLALASDEFLETLQPCLRTSCDAVSSCLTKSLQGAGCL